MTPRPPLWQPINFWPTFPGGQQWQMWLIQLSDLFMVFLITLLDIFGLMWVLKRQVRYLETLNLSQYRKCIERKRHSKRHKINELLVIFLEESAHLDVCKDRMLTKRIFQTTVLVLYKPMQVLLLKCSAASWKRMNQQNFFFLIRKKGESLFFYKRPFQLHMFYISTQHHNHQKTPKSLSVAQIFLIVPEPRGKNKEVKKKNGLR